MYFLDLGPPICHCIGAPTATRECGPPRSVNRLALRWMFGGWAPQGPIAPGLRSAIDPPGLPGDVLPRSRHRRTTARRTRGTHSPAPALGPGPPPHQIRARSARRSRRLVPPPGCAVSGCPGLIFVYSPSNPTRRRAAGNREVERRESAVAWGLRQQGRYAPPSNLDPGLWAAPRHRPRPGGKVLPRLDRWLPFRYALQRSGEPFCSLDVTWLPDICRISGIDRGAKGSSGRHCRRLSHAPKASQADTSI
mgnify:CR=1 FL=1